MDSPSMPKKGRPRRSLSLKTPRNKAVRGDPVSLDSPELFAGSPNLTASDSRLNLCSTPVNQGNRKRSLFIDDNSPFVASESSLDVSGLHYQASPNVSAAANYPTMSQEMRRVGLDVVWQWNSPKRNVNLDRNHGPADGEIAPMARKRRKSFGTDGQSTSQSSSGGVDKTTGFYKIREQLLRAKKEDSLFMRLLQDEEDFPAASEEVLANNEEASSKEQADKDATLTRKLSDEYLNDSDNDENLLIVSQETEMKVQQEELEKLASGGGGKKTQTSVVQTREMSFTNDSFDQYLIDIPFDELLNRKAAESGLNETLKHTNSPRGGGKKGLLNRTQSMPPDTNSVDGKGVLMPPGGSNSTNSSSSGVVAGSTASSGSHSSRAMTRHESMPMSTRGSRNSGSRTNRNGEVASNNQLSASNPSLAQMMPSSSSAESLYSTSSTASTEKSRVCSQSEIARKRQIAQERLKLKQQQQQRQRQRSFTEQPTSRK